MPRKRYPRAAQDDEKFAIIKVAGASLDLSELLATGVLVVFIPLFSFGAKLPLPLWILLLVSFPMWAILLFIFPRRDGLNMSEWLGILLPYWTRQHTFLLGRQAAHQTPFAERLDMSITAGPNLISWEWSSGADGADELHIFEDPRLSLRALIERDEHERRRRALALEQNLLPLPAFRRPGEIELPA
jgi:hypothetical protein